MTISNRLGNAIGATCVAVIALSTVSPGYAQQNSVPDAIRKLREMGHTVTEMGITGVLAGWFVEVKGEKPYAIYTTNDGHSVMGMLYNQNQQLVTGIQIRAVIDTREEKTKGNYKGNYTVAPTEFKRQTAQTQSLSGQSPQDQFSVLSKMTRNLNGFKIGDRGVEVQVFVDPFCPYSRKYVANIEEKARNGLLQAKIIPVSIFPNSKKHAEAISSSPDGLQAWKQLHRSVRVSDEYLSSAGAKNIKQNNQAFFAWGAKGVPLTVMGNTEGANLHAATVEYGKPKSIETMLRRGNLL